MTSNVIYSRFWACNVFYIHLYALCAGVLNNIVHIQLFY